MLSRADAEEEIRELLQQKERLLLKKLYKENLWELCKLIGFKDLGQCHRDLCDVLKNTEMTHNRRIFQLPRGHFKTSVITIADSVRRILNNPDIRILIASSTLDNAKECVRIIKDVFWKNEEFRKIFPEFCPPDEAREFGTQTEFSVPNRKSLVLKNSTVEVAGDGQTITGRHYDVIKFSDIVTDKNSQSKYQLDNTVKWVSYCISLLDNPTSDTCHVDIEGTRYDHGDVYGEWISKAKDSNNFLTYIKPAIFINDSGEEVSLFRERFSVKGLRDIEVEQGSFIFAGQYMLSPMDEGTAAFKRDKLVFVARNTIPRMKDNKFKYPLYMTIDLAISESSTADHSVLTVGMCDEDNKLWVIDIRKGHWGLDKIKSNVWFMYDHYKPRLIGMETVAFQKLFLPIFKDLGRENGIILPIKEIPRDTTKSKIMRILSLVPRFEQNKIVFCEDVDKPFVTDQILRFSPDKKNNKDDLLDTLADLDLIKIIPNREEVNPYDKFPARRYIDWLNSTDRDTDDFQIKGEGEEDDYLFG